MEDCNRIPCVHILAAADIRTRVEVALSLTENSSWWVESRGPQSAGDMEIVDSVSNPTLLDKTTAPA
jgi:hypothetical protein